MVKWSQRLPHPWEVVISTAAHNMCEQTYQFLSKACWSKEVSPKEISALMQSAQICQGRLKKEISKLEKGNNNGSRNPAIGVRKDKLERNQETIERVQAKFGTDTPSNLPYDLPRPVHEAYEHRQDNKENRQALKESTTREVCNEVNGILKDAFYKLRLAEAHNIDTVLDKSESAIACVTDLLSATRVCEEIDSKQKK